MTPAPAGANLDIKFVDVEDALRDAHRFVWILPLIDGSPDSVGTLARSQALFDAHNKGHRGRALVDEAMKAAP